MGSLIDVNEICGMPKLSRTHPIRYRGYSIFPGRFVDAFEFAHDDFDEDPTAGDQRYGSGATVDHCRAEIDEIEGGQTITALDRAEYIGELRGALEVAVEALAMCEPRTRHGATCQQKAMLYGRAVLARKWGLAVPDVP